MKDAVLKWALRAAGATGVTFDQLRRWLSPWGWGREDLASALRSLREGGHAVLEEGADGTIVAIALTSDGEREMGEAGHPRASVRANEPLSRPR